MHYIGEGAARNLEIPTPRPIPAHGARVLLLRAGVALRGWAADPVPREAGAAAAYRKAHDACLR